MLNNSCSILKLKESPGENLVKIGKRPKREDLEESYVSIKQGKMAKGNNIVGTPCQHSPRSLARLART